MAYSDDAEDHENPFSDNDSDVDVSPRRGADQSFCSTEHLSGARPTALSQPPLQAHLEAHGGAVAAYRASLGMVRAVSEDTLTTTSSLNASPQRIHRPRARPTSRSSQCSSPHVAQAATTLEHTSLQSPSIDVSLERNMKRDLMTAVSRLQLPTKQVAVMGWHMDAHPVGKQIPSVIARNAQLWKLYDSRSHGILAAAVITLLSDGNLPSPTSSTTAAPAVQGSPLKKQKTSETLSDEQLRGMCVCLGTPLDRVRELAHEISEELRVA